MEKFGGSFWDERYSSGEFVYGIEPNIFFKNEIDKLEPGRILLPGEGEGRNAVYAAKKGWQVDAVDFSTVAKEKALQFAKENSVSINYEISDLSEYAFKTNYYDAAAMIFLHLNPKIRTDIHNKIIQSLKHNGRIICEAYAKEQIYKSSGGPKNPDMLYSEEDLRNDFAELNILQLSKKTIHLKESKHHEGEAVVIRLIAVKP